MRSLSVITLLGFSISYEPPSSSYPSALVKIHAYGKSHTSGTGFFVDTGGVVATALHVIVGKEPDDYPDSVVVITNAGKRYKVTSVLGMNIPMDICIVKVNFSNSDYLRLADRLNPGDSVIIPGDPEIRTVFSGLHKDEHGYEYGYLNAPLEPGYSGSPVLSGNEVIGIATSTTGFYGIFTPSNYLRTLLANKKPITLRNAHSALAGTPWGFLLFALAAKKLGDLSSTIMYLKKATNMDPPVASIYVQLGSLFLDQGNLSEAEKNFREALRINPELDEIHYNLGLLFYEQFRLSEAEQEYREAIRINPNFADAHNNLGLVLYTMCRLSEAEKEYKEAIRINPNLGEAHYNLGLLFKTQEKYKQARNELQKALEIFEKQGDSGKILMTKMLLESLPK
ncbi:MAG: tetratricopeptide repeat protein [candidate division WOR-3 bacterium]